jgi:hypothetical protein
VGIVGNDGGDKMKLRKTNDDKLIFYCEGCKECHGVNSGWTFNGDFDKPTFSPSILVRSIKMTAKGESDYEEWCSLGYPKTNEPFDSIPTICHSFVTDGKIQYLSDCTHDLAGQTIELIDWLSKNKKEETQ